MQKSLKVNNCTSELSTMSKVGFSILLISIGALVDCFIWGCFSTFFREMGWNKRILCYSISCKRLKIWTFQLQHYAHFLWLKIWRILLCQFKTFMNLLVDLIKIKGKSHNFLNRSLQDFVDDIFWVRFFFFSLDFLHSFHFLFNSSDTEELKS